MGIVTRGGSSVGLWVGLLTMATLTAAGPARTQWKLGEHTWVKRVPAEAGAPLNDHPAKFDRAALQQRLGEVRFLAEGQEIPLFHADELISLAEPLREALSLAGPGEDIVLLSTHKRGGSFLSSAYGLTARLFVQDGQLQLLVHDARLDFVDRYRGSQVLPEFHFGARNLASGIILKHSTATARRNDWLSLPLVGLAAEAPGTKAAPVPATVPPPPKTAPGASTKARDAAFFMEQEERLRALKRMREENLITEAEYQQKRQDVLQGL